MGGAGKGAGAGTTAGGQICSPAVVRAGFAAVANNDFLYS